MGVALVRNVKDELVDGGVENVVQGDFCLYGAEVGTAVTADFGEAVEQGFANVASEGGQGLQIELFDVCRGIDLA